jgi:hypothetical protein
MDSRLRISGMTALTKTFYKGLIISSNPPLSGIKDIFMYLDIQSDTQSVFNDPGSKVPGLKHTKAGGKQHLAPFLQTIF